jgi:L-amino acid N-acyltransferase YncA
MKRCRTPPPENHPVPEVVRSETQSSWLQEDSSQQRLLPTPNQSQLEATKAIIRKATRNDIWSLYELYKIVARVNRGNLTQEEDEIPLKYISEVVKNGIERGLVLVIDQENQIIGYLKAFTSRFRCLAHVLTNATMMVHPEWQGKGYGSQLMDAYLEEIQANMPHILRFELLPHQGNQRAIKFYERHGFVRESLASQKIRNPQGNFDSEVTLVWFNPNFSEEGLKRYHAFLSRLSH